MSDQSLSNIHIFSIRHITTFLHLGTVDSMTALGLEGFLHSELTNKKHKHAKHMALRRLHEGQLFYNTRTETIRQSLSLFDLSWEPAR